MEARMIRMYGIPNCDTVKKARAWLAAARLEYTFVDFKKTPPDAALVARWCKALGVETLVNRRGTTWRGLDAATQARAATAAGAVAVLVANPSAIRRPVIESGATLLAGFDAAAYAERLGVRGRS
jgi:arsenate reductase (glutaredoxin)